MNIKCDVIRDLLPLYMDDLVSEETKRLVDEHLEQCEDCRKYLDELKGSEEQPVSREFAGELEPLKKIKRKALVNRVALLILALIIAAAGIGVIAYIIGPSESQKIQDNVAYTVHEGYELDESDCDDRGAVYKRETDENIETLSIYYPYPGETSIEGEKVELGEGWEGGMYAYADDDDHSSFNHIDGVLRYEDDYFEVDYLCQVKDRGYYYDSCSPKQQEEVVEFMRTFEHKDPPPAEGNVFQRIFNNLGFGGIIFGVVFLLVFIGVPLGASIGGLMGGGKDDFKYEREEKEMKTDNGPVSSKDLHKEMNIERKNRGDGELPAINTVTGVSTNNLARRDKSWSSVPDFFIKLIRGKHK